MALKVALLCFQFKNIDDILHDPLLEHNFANKDPPLSGETIQPIVAEAVARMKRAIAGSISAWFNFGRTIITNISNFLHIATITFNTEIEHTDGSTGQTSIVIVIKFYHMEDEDSYRVTLDIEGMQSSAIATYEEDAYEEGITAEQIERLVELLGNEFELDGGIECTTTLIERGRLHCAKWENESEERRCKQQQLINELPPNNNDDACLQETGLEN